MTVFLWILFTIFLLFAIMLFIPLRIDVSISSKKSSAYLRILFLEKKLFSSDDKDKKTIKVNKNKSIKKKTSKRVSAGGVEAESKQKEIKKKKGPQELIDTLRLFLDPAPKLLRFVFGGVKIQRLKFIWRISTEDASQTAILYGRACAAVSGILPLIKNIFNPEIKRIYIYPDFCTEETAYLVSFRIRTRLYRPTVGLIRYLIAIIKNKTKVANKTVASV